MGRLERAVLLVVVTVAGGCGVSPPSEGPDAGARDAGERDAGSAGEPLFPTVRTIISARCTTGCHSNESGHQSGLPVVLDTDDDIALRHDAIKAAVADPVSPGPSGNRRMPPSGALSAEEVDVIVRWSARGGRVTD